MKFFLTGGSGGIGAELAVALATAGHDVAFTWYRDAAGARATQDRIAAVAPASQALCLELDVRDPAAVATVGDSASTALGGIDAVICNAAITRIAPVPLTEDADWREVIDTNLTGSFWVARHFSTAFLAQRHGRFIFISSVAAAGMNGQASYAASKAGLLGLSGTLAREFGPRGVTSNVITLGLFDAGMGQRDATDQLRKFWTSSAPVRRMGRAEEVTQAVLYLASDAAAFVTGQDLRLTGGLDWAP